MPNECTSRLEQWSPAFGSLSVMQDLALVLTSSTSSISTFSCLLVETHEVACDRFEEVLSLIVNLSEKSLVSA